MRILGGDESFNQVANWVVSRERGTGYKGVRWLCLHLPPLKRGIRFHDGNEYFNRDTPRGLSSFFHRQSNFNYHINPPSLFLSLSSFKHPRSETPVASGEDFYP